MEIIVVGEHLISKRLDVALSHHPKIASRSEAKRLIKESLVSINDSFDHIKPKRILKAGDIISFIVRQVTESSWEAVPYALDIVFEDNYLLVVNKPRGMVVHPAVGHPNNTLVNYLLYHTSLSGIDSTRPGIVHRIDKDTSGLLVVAKDNRTHEHLAEQFAAHTAKRKYQGIVWGVPDYHKGTIDQPLGRHPLDRKKFAIRENGKAAITHWRVVEKYQHLSLFE